ncbi:MAG: hypothetical protein J6U35_01275 [Clostridia bacterium]|nr:hypothetical protein [Clostridia bacterium]
MKYEFQKEFCANYSTLDHSMRQGLTSCFMWQQDMLTEYFESFGSDNITLKTKCGALWVFTKTIIKIFRLPVWRQKVFARSYTTKVTKATFDAETVFSDENGQTLFVFRSEACAMDAEGRKLRRIESVIFPKDMECLPPLISEGFSRPRTSASEPCLKYKISATDIDFSSHVNNVNYVKLTLNALSVDFLTANDVTFYEIHFFRETLLGDEISVFKEEKEGEIYFSLQNKSGEVAAAKMCYLKS